MAPVGKMDRRFSARITLFDRAWYLRDLPRMIQQVNHVTRAKKAGLNARHVNKVRRYFDPFPYYMRKEMRALINDMKRNS